MKFRKKPIVIEAQQYLPFQAIPQIPEGVHWDGNMVEDAWDGRPTWIFTSEGKMSVNPYDWIITGIAGEKYPCHPKTFDETYERVEE